MDSISTIKDEKFTCSCVSYADMESDVIETPRTAKPLDASSFIQAEPCYKFVKDLLLWDISFVDIVLISSPMGMMGLPFLTRNRHFSAKVYVTEATARIGQLMMEDLVTMHKEFSQFYGPEDSGAHQWMEWEELEFLPLELKNVALGADGTEFGGWMPLYSAADVKDCMLKIETLRYAEEVCYGGPLIIKAFSSGLEIGSCNWSISGPKGNIAYISSSVVPSATAMGFNYKALERHDVTLFSDISCCNATEKLEDDSNCFGSSGNSLSNSSESLEEMERLDFICSCSMDSVTAGGSVLIPIGRLAIVLQLLERFALGLESENMKVPIFFVSSVAEELIAFTNVIPEWLCQQRLERLYSGQSLFSHVEMLAEGRLHLFSAIYSPKLILAWQEPCIVFCPHWSLRLGPAIHLIRRWCNDKNSLLVMEEGFDADLVLLPFKPMEMKVLQCSFSSGMPLQQALRLVKNLQPRHVLFPETFKQHISPLEHLFSLQFYSKSNTLQIPNMKEDTELDISIELASRLHYTTLEGIDVSRLKGELIVEQGRHRLYPWDEHASSPTRPVTHCFGRVDLNALLIALQKVGLNATIVDDAESDGVRVLHVSEPAEARVEVTEAQTLISTGNENLASLISKVVCSILDCL
ncbi:hypothetical protein F511_07718 [Dorcoceras hygrometricum]|uniref:Beta-Casp domain-containing protein n=1 Tax=Dorcoceras hygrometricum TaxID=472368 RepID=A0A2Z7CLT0_9LAMI|nr:hypothetical protein F511_07718 [Dorcoceras hygrometricum]